MPEEVGATMPTMNAMKKKVRRARRVAAGPAPPVPNTRNGWDFPPEHEFFDDGSRFLLHDSGPNDPQRFIILGSERALETIGNGLHFFSDGTFKGIPLFPQLYSIHQDYVSN